MPDGKFIIDVVLECLKLRFGQIVDRAIDRLGIRDEGNFMVDTRSMRREPLRVLFFEHVGELGVFRRNRGRRICINCIDVSASSLT